MTVSETMRIAGSASAATIARPSIGGRKSVITPVTRAAETRGGLLDDGREQVLAGERVAHLDVVGRDAGADDGEVAVAAGVHQPVEIDLEMGAVEVADAEVEDAGREVAAGVVGRATPAGSSVEGREREGSGHRGASSDCAEHAAVDEVGAADRVGGAVGAEEDHEVGELLDGAEALDRRVLVGDRLEVALPVAVPVGLGVGGELLRGLDPVGRAGSGRG